MNRLAQIVAGIVALLLLVAVAINFSNVFSRYVLDSPFSWGDEAMGFLQVGMVVIGAALVTRRNVHLRMDALEHVMPEGARRWLDIFACVLTIAVSIVVFAMSWRIVAGMFQDDTRSIALNMPQGIPYAAFPLGFGLMGLFAALRLVELVRRK